MDHVFSLVESSYIADFGWPILRTPSLTFLECLLHARQNCLGSSRLRALCLQTIASVVTCQMSLWVSATHQVGLQSSTLCVKLLFTNKALYGFLSSLFKFCIIAGDFVVNILGRWWICSHAHPERTTSVNELMSAFNGHAYIGGPESTLGLSLDSPQRNPSVDNSSMSVGHARAQLNQNLTN